MKKLLQIVHAQLRRLDYEKAGARFFKVENHFFKLIDIQSGAHGSYFFVNLCLHPVGMPELLAGKLVIPNRPLEHECIVRQRIEDAVPGSSTDVFRAGLVPTGDTTAIERLLPSLAGDAQLWLSRWCDFDRVISTPDSELQRMLTVSPVVRVKACRMLKLYCAIRNESPSLELLKDYLSAPAGGYDFSHVDSFLRSLQAEQDLTAR